MRLPIMLDPPIKYTPVHSHFVSIILQNEDGVNWLYDHYINIYLRIKNDKQEVRFETQANYTDLSLLDRNYSPFLNFYYIPRDFIKDIINNLKEILNLNYYIFLRLNHKCIPDSLNYQRKDYYHTALVHGYDNNGFIVTDYFKYKMETKKIFIESFIKAFTDVPLIYTSPHYHFHQNELALFKINTKATYSFSINLMKNSLVDYLNGTDSIGRNYNEIPWFNIWESYEVYHGLSCLKFFPELLYKNKIGYKEAYLLVEWTDSMIRRLEFLIKNSYITANSSKLYEYIKAANKTSKILESLAIKEFFASNMEGNLASITYQCNKLYDEEKCFVNELLDSIK